MARYLIVGGSSGIGEALATKLITNNHEVIILSRSEPLLPGATYMACDVTQDPLPEIEGILNGLVYCPGSINLKPLRQLTEEDFRHDFEVNCLGAVKVVLSYLPLLQGGHPSSMVFYSTVAVQRGMAFHTSIAAAKGAIEGMTRSLASELSPEVRVNCIAPSLTETPLSQKLMRGRDALEKRHPLKRLGKADDIAAMTAFLLSEDASWITGQIIGVDGGMSSLSVF
ncbi:MAG: SDR family oxidoreductase [Chlamydiota bacterium]|nr:SDR family oxidoreductase [Chlamydiota bacterium]